MCVSQNQPKEHKKIKQPKIESTFSLICSFLLFTMMLVGSPLNTKAQETDNLIQQLESITTADIRSYQLKSSQGKGMDCLKVFQPLGDEYNGRYFGVYHHLKNGRFGIHLAKSTDLRKWQDILLLDEHASQPTVFVCEQGDIVLAYEKDAPNSCWIRLRYYESLTHLLEGKHAKEHDIPRSLAPTAEGTPSFESVTLGKEGIEQSEIHLRFHYFKGIRVDQLAAGTLTNFKHWQAEPSYHINQALIHDGWNGNLGDRDPFIWEGQTYYLQETQGKGGDWSSWRINLCDARGMPIRTLSFQTHKNSQAFANPNATWVIDSKNRRQMIVTLFLPSEGNATQEAGTLLYVINP
jgi:hypothetical protein